jgi:predicted nucleotide-binding protein
MDKVFIFHAQDELMKIKVQLLLSRSGIIDVTLNECPNKGRTELDKLIEESEGAIYAIALLSSDDNELFDGNVGEGQDVVFGIGYLLGKLGKQKVRLLVEGDMEIPSALQGIPYEKFDENGDWKAKLLKEIQKVIKNEAL